MCGCFGESHQCLAVSLAKPIGRNGDGFDPQAIVALRKEEDADQAIRVVQHESRALGRALRCRCLWKDCGDGGGVNVDSAANTGRSGVDWLF